MRFEDEVGKKKKEMVLVSDGCRVGDEGSLIQVKWCACMSKRIPSGAYRV